MLDETDLESGDFAPLDMIEEYCTAHGWSHERAEDELVAEVKGSWTKYELRALWREEDGVLQFLALPDIKVADDKLGPVCETLALINEQLWLGHFELWSSSGMVIYRHAALLPDAGQATLTLAAAETIIETAIDECERFYPVFQFVLWGGKTPREALAAAMVDTAGEA